jgi:hypothetical protein
MTLGWNRIKQTLRELITSSGLYTMQFLLEGTLSGFGANNRMSKIHTRMYLRGLLTLTHPHLKMTLLIDSANN